METVETARPVLKEFYTARKMELNKRKPKMEPVRRRQVAKVLDNYEKG